MDMVSYRNMKKRFVKTIKLRKYNNLIEVIHVNAIVKKLSGLIVFELGLDEANLIVAKFSAFGIVTFNIWLGVYYFCAYRALNEDQTILRKLYETKLLHYGDAFEKLVSIAFVTYTMWKIPFHTGLATDYMKKMIDVDNSIEKLGMNIDYNKDAFTSLKISIAQVIAGSTRLFSVWITLAQLEIAMPLELLFQESITDILALVTTAHYCFYVNILRERYKAINTMLTEIKDRRSWEQRLFHRTRQPVNVQKVLIYEDRHICEKMRSCAKSYSLLLKAVESCQEMFGFALVVTFLFCLFYVVLYLFYFMEATAAGLFSDTQRYLYFLLYVFWQILYTAGVIFLNIYFSETTVEEAGKTSYIMHEIINSDISPLITDQAMRFSQQLLHQQPVFTACGLCRIDYMLLLQGAYSVTTFLVILLQFVTD